MSVRINPQKWADAVEDEPEEKQSASITIKTDNVPIIQRPRVWIVFKDEWDYSEKPPRYYDVIEDPTNTKLLTLVNENQLAWFHAFDPDHESIVYRRSRTNALAQIAASSTYLSRVYFAIPKLIRDLYLKKNTVTETVMQKPSSPLSPTVIHVKNAFEQLNMSDRSTKHFLDNMNDKFQSVVQQAKKRGIANRADLKEWKRHVNDKIMQYKDSGNEKKVAKYEGLKHQIKELLKVVEK
jgi:hypothetical protein